MTVACCIEFVTKLWLHQSFKSS